MATKIFVTSNLLREPQLFDKICSRQGQVGRLARDLILYACWNKAVVVRLHVPEFCKMFGYDRALLLRKATEDQKREMLECSLPPRLLPYYSNFLGYVLVRMANYNFLWNERPDDSRDTSVRPHRIVERIDAFRVRKTGSYAEFTMSRDIVEQSRELYQRIYLEDYLSLVTKPGGYAWESARKLFLRVSWKRRWMDRPNASLKGNPSHDNYADLVHAAGLDNIKPARNQASKLLKLLKVVGEQPSVCMIPHLHHQRGAYQVSWTRYDLWTVGGPPKHVRYPLEPAPATWGTDPNPPATTPADVASLEADELLSTAWAPAPGPKPAPVATSSSPAPMQRISVLHRDRREVEEDLHDALGSLRWLQSPDAAGYYAKQEPGKHALNLQECEHKIAQLRRELET